MTVPYHCRYLEPVGVLPGVGPKIASFFERKGIFNVADLLYTLPARYDDRRLVSPIQSLAPGRPATVRGTLTQVRSMGGRGRWRRTVAELADDSGTMAVVWFGFAGQRFAKGDRVQLSGPVDTYQDRLQLQNPDGDIYSDDEPPPAAIVPLYSELEGVGQRTWRKLQRVAGERFAGDWIGGVPAPLREREGLLTVGAALRLLHQPPADLPGEVESLLTPESPPLRSLIWDEWFVFQLAMQLRRRLFTRATGIAFHCEPSRLDALLASLPFSLTADQANTWREILTDLQSDRPMHRLLHGEVGSGKTILAVLAAFVAVQSGYQAAILAPTEILAEQHWERFSRILEPHGISCVLLIGTEAPPKKRRLKDLVRLGSAHVVIGTHALLSGDVEFSRLGLAVIDEQHKFGVEQRAKLVSKGIRPDVLVLSATPIPRSLALTMCGDLDISVLREKPGGAGNVATRLVARADREAMYREVADRLRQGQRGYIVAPRLAAATEGQSDAVQLHAELKHGALREFRLEVLHGKVMPEARRRIIAALAKGDLDAIVATTVVEVGLDIPSAGVLVVENAERFGLSQLHQMRGRIGRDGADALCLLSYDEQSGEKSLERLRLLASCHDGFAIAEADLKLRGPGEMMGARQSGLPPLRFGKWILRELSLLEDIHRAAAEVLAADPALADPAHHWAKMVALQRWGAWLGEGGYG